MGGTRSCNVLRGCDDRWRIIKDFGMFSAEKACFIIVPPSCVKIGQRFLVRFRLVGMELRGDRRAFPSHVINRLWGCFCFLVFSILLVVGFLWRLRFVFILYCAILFFFSRLSFPFLHTYILSGRRKNEGMKRGRFLKSYFCDLDE